MNSRSSPKGLAQRRNLELQVVFLDSCRRPDVGSEKLIFCDKLSACFDQDTEDFQGSISDGHRNAIRDELPRMLHETKPTEDKRLSPGAIRNACLPPPAIDPADVRMSLHPAPSPVQGAKPPEALLAKSHIVALRWRESCWPPIRLTLSNRRSDAIEQLGFVERLGQITEHAGPQCPRANRFVGVAGDQNGAEIEKPSATRRS